MTQSNNDRLDRDRTDRPDPLDDALSESSRGRAFKEVGNPKSSDAGLWGEHPNALAQVDAARLSDTGKPSSPETTRASAIADAQQPGLPLGKPRAEGSPFSAPATDETIEDRLESALALHPHLETDRVEFEVVDREIVVTGAVPTAEDRLAVSELCASVLGVERVENDLQIHI